MQQSEMRKTVFIDGLHVPMTTPFYRDGRLYVRKLEHNVARLSLTPVHGLVALTGEGTELTDAERRESLAAVRAVAAKEKVLVATIAQPTVFAALEAAADAEAAEFDALLLQLPAVLSVTEQMLWVRSIADATTLPVLLWSGADAAQLSVETLAELALHPNVHGVYDAALTTERLAAVKAATAHVQLEATVTTTFTPVTRRMLTPVAEDGAAATFVSAESLAGGTAVAVAPRVVPTLKTRTKVVGFQIIAAGSTRNEVDLLEAGAAGVMPTLAASLPQACHEVYAAFRDGDPALGALKAHRLEAADALIAERGIAAVKYGSELAGYYGGAPRLPRLPLTAAEREQVERAFGTLRS